MGYLAVETEEVAADGKHREVERKREIGERDRKRKGENRDRGGGGGNRLFKLYDQQRHTGEASIALPRSEY